MQILGSIFIKINLLAELGTAKLYRKTFFIRFNTDTCSLENLRALFFRSMNMEILATSIIVMARTISAFVEKKRIWKRREIDGWTQTKNTKLINKRELPIAYDVLCV